MAHETAGEWGVVAPTFEAARTVCFEGQSGLIRAFGTTLAEVKRGASKTVLSYNLSTATLRLRNGSIIYGDGADDGAPTIQGKNLRGLWADEVGLWRKWQQAWEESIRYAVRLAPARIIATGTPKRGHPLVRSLMADTSVYKTLLKTSDNAANLDPALLQELYAKYGGTSLGRQELEGEILDDMPGALWRRSMLEMLRITVKPAMSKIVVAIDPAATSNEGADETGIVVAGSNGSHGYVLEDLSLRATPHLWATAAIEAYHRWQANMIVAEDNNGGEMIEHVIHSIDPTVPVKRVHASRGKAVRAEPIHALYEQGKVHHVGTFELLEDQMCQWTPSDIDSPDRMDALVWAITALDLIPTGSNPWASIETFGGVA
jgi:phage terminase large subunit-like protein